MFFSFFFLFLHKLCIVQHAPNAKWLSTLFLCIIFTVSKVSLFFLQVAVEQLLKLKSLSQPVERVLSGQLGSVAAVAAYNMRSPGLSPPPESLPDAASGIASHLQAGGACCPWEEWIPVSLPAMYSELYSFFGDSLAVRFSTGSGFGTCPPCTPFQVSDAKKEAPSSATNSETTRKMPQLTANLNISPSQDGSPCPESQLPSLTAAASGR